ncbi:hypothetical protein FB565_004968 [Actinoplanes lutulentus]|uniref:DUF2218 domain-containing protein n=1 Tax=Actinoplanes lutulentus TaxID=1287878 RepID=A0A327ZJK0_9ACTN|nr:DUF2218 domain-containing protein [Actinoplanes lutulentus]MBB2945235.1 hypothetical protein [Actinoplanes lutulentus]RAK40629.1 hypothetical protein B0I29_103669 [Actinoplanes lutulentus]
MSTATASVATTAAPRYAKQLASHLGRRSEIREIGEDIAIVLTVGECRLHSTETALEMTATAATEDDLQTVTKVVGSHLERFGQRNELTVTWNFEK